MLRVPPAPVETSIDIQSLQTAKGPVVRLFFHTPTGVGIYWLAAEQAETIGEAVAASARQAKSGLHIARNGDVP